MGAALVGLSALGDLPWWVTAVILFRELGITALRFWVIRHGVIPASRGGKIKTLAQGVAVGMYILVLTGPLATIRAWMMALAVILTVATGVDYVRQAIVVRRAGLAAERAVAVAASEAMADAAVEVAASEAMADAAGRRGGGRARGKPARMPRPGRRRVPLPGVWVRAPGPVPVARTGPLSRPPGPNGRTAYDGRGRRRTAAAGRARLDPGRRRVPHRRPGGRGADGVPGASRTFRGSVTAVRDRPEARSARRGRGPAGRSGAP